MSDLIIRRLEQAPDLLHLQQCSPLLYPFLLDSAAGPTGLTRYSLLLRVDPDHAPILADENITQIKDAARDVSVRDIRSDFFQRLDVAWRQSRTASKPQPALPFVGGWFLYLGYELAGLIEPALQLPPSPDPTPMAGAWRCPGAFIIDHHESSAWLVAESVTLADAMMAEYESSVVSAPSRQSNTDPATQLDLTVEDPQRYCDAVNQIKEYILAGDVFQVNLSRVWRGEAQTPLDPHQLYRQLRQANPAPFAALCRIGESWILSSSPERLVEMADGTVQTRPIAGTRPRSTESDADRALGEELLLHPKERAEHVMLIDLERNDLGRVCEPGSIHVSELMVLESHAHVHHIVSNVRGRLLADATAGEVIKAVFPGGTITGCPKVRCMEIIAELEQVGRGYYTGSLGYLSRHGHMDLNILIRTLIVDGRRLAFRTGAGIVADSDAQREVEETVAKARGLCLALGYNE